MKIWVICILLLVLVGLTFPLANADNVKTKKGTPAKFEIKSDPLIGLKKVIGMESASNVDVIINDVKMATIPDNSPLVGIEPTEECLKFFSYGTKAWYECEVGT
jgi:hypothetical protein